MHGAPAYFPFRTDAPRSPGGVGYIGRGRCTGTALWMEETDPPFKSPDDPMTGHDAVRFAMKAVQKNGRMVLL